MYRSISLEELEINVTIMTFGSLIYAIFHGLNLIYVFTSHKGDFLIQLLLLAWILQYMAGRILSTNLVFLTNVTMLFYLMQFLFFCLQVWWRWTSSQWIVSVAGWSRAFKWSLLHSHVQTFWNLLESRKEDYPRRSRYPLGTEVHVTMPLLITLFVFTKK